MTGFSFRRLLAVLQKESIQMRRDPATIALTMALPLLQLFLFGYALNASNLAGFLNESCEHSS